MQLNEQGASLKLDGSYGPLTQVAALRYCKPPAGGPVISGVSGPQTLGVNQQGTWIVKAYDSSGDDLSYLVNWGDDDSRQMGYNPSSMDTTTYQSATFTHKYAIAGTYTATFYVTNSSGQREQTSLSVKVGNVTDKIISEQVKCVFSGSRTTQSCYTTNRAGKEYTFSGTETAGGTVSGYSGETLAWKSSCGGYAYTIMDRENEYARFSCTDDPSSITVTSPNGGETWKKGATQTIKWRDPTGSSCPEGAYCLRASTSYDIFLNGLASCSENVCTTGFSVWTIAKGVSGLSYRWKIPDCTTTNVCSSNFDIPAGTYQVQVCRSGTNTCDSSDSYFKVANSDGNTDGFAITTPSPLPDGQVKDSYMVVLEVSGLASGTSTNNLYWSVVKGALPSGIYLSASDYGEILTGVPTKDGTYAFVLQAALNNPSSLSTTAVKEFTLRVNSGVDSGPGTLSISPDPVTITAGDSEQVQAFYAPSCSSELACPQVVQEVNATWSVGNNSIANVMYAIADCNPELLSCVSKTYVSVYGVSPGVTELTAKYAVAGRILTKTIPVYVLPLDSANL
jgi:hypothetical protein